MPSARQIPRLYWTIALLAASLWCALGSQIVPYTCNHDFLNFYYGAALIRDGQPQHFYETSLPPERVQEMEPKQGQLVVFVRPAFYAVLLTPLAWLRPSPAFWVWVSVHSVLLVGIWLWGVRRFGPDALVLGAFYLPAALGIAHGQDGVFLLCILAASYGLALRRKSLASGAVLALGLLKFHLFLLFPLGMILSRRWRMLAGFGITGLLEATASTALVGTSGVERYLSLLQRKDLPGMAPNPELMINLHSILANMQLHSSGVMVALALLVVALWATSLHRAPLWRWYASTVTATLLLLPHVYGYDAAMLLLPLWAAYFGSCRLTTRISAIAVLTPLGFFTSLAGPPWAAVPAMLLLAFLAAQAWEAISVQEGEESAAVPQNSVIA